MELNEKQQELLNWVNGLDMSNREVRDEVERNVVNALNDKLNEVRNGNSVSIDESIIFPLTRVIAARRGHPEVKVGADAKENYGAQMYPDKRDLIDLNLNAMTINNVDTESELATKLFGDLQTVNHEMQHINQFNNLDRFGLEGRDGSINSDNIMSFNDLTYMNNNDAAYSEKHDEFPIELDADIAGIIDAQRDLGDLIPNLSESIQSQIEKDATERLSDEEEGLLVRLQNRVKHPVYRQEIAQILNGSPNLQEIYERVSKGQPIGKELAESISQEDLDRLKDCLGLTSNQNIATNYKPNFTGDSEAEFNKDLETILAKVIIDVEDLRKGDKQGDNEENLIKDEENLNLGSEEQNIPNVLGSVGSEIEETTKESSFEATENAEINLHPDIENFVVKFHNKENFSMEEFEKFKKACQDIPESEIEEVINNTKVLEDPETGVTVSSPVSPVELFRNAEGEEVTYKDLSDKKETLAASSLNEEDKEYFSGLVDLVVENDENLNLSKTVVDEMLNGTSGTDTAETINSLPKEDRQVVEDNVREYMEETPLKPLIDEERLDESLENIGDGMVQASDIGEVAIPTTSEIEAQNNFEGSLEVSQEIENNAVGNELDIEQPESETLEQVENGIEQSAEDAQISGQEEDLGVSLPEAESLAGLLEESSMNATPEISGASLESNEPESMATFNESAEITAGNAVDSFETIASSDAFASDMEMPASIAPSMENAESFVSSGFESALETGGIAEVTSELDSSQKCLIVPVSKEEVDAEKKKNPDLFVTDDMLVYFEPTPEEKERQRQEYLEKHPHGMAYIYEDEQTNNDPIYKNENNEKSK